MTSFPPPQRQPVDFTKIEDDVALVTINRPDARNAVTAELANALEEIVADIEARADIRVAIITGAGGKAFCSGADLHQVAAGGLDAMFTATAGFAGFVHNKRVKPWIAAVDGFALAGGFEIMLACDLAVATERSKFGLPEVSRGLIASAGGVYRLPRSIPKCVAMEMIATGRTMDAERAFSVGLINRLVPTEALFDTTMELARAIVANAPLAVQESVAIARLSDDYTDAELRRLGDEAQQRLQQSADYVEGAVAFTEKRAPRWTGR